MASVLVPVLYVLIVFGSLFVFSYYYRKRAAATLVEPYFPSHPDRDTYVTLLQRTDPPASDALLKSALVRRAMGDVNRVLRIREDKPALQNLLQKGSIGDDIWNSLLAAEKELEAEIMEVVAEANTFVEGWGTVIFQTANEMIANEKMRSLFEKTTEDRKAKMVKYNIQTKAITTPVTLVASTSSSVPPTSAAPKPTNGLVPPTPESLATSSDGESIASPKMPRTSSKSGKKSKKRK